MAYEQNMSTADFSNVLLNRLEKIKNVRTQKGFERLWNNEVKRIKERQKEKPSLITNKGYMAWKQKLTRLYQYSASMRKWPDPSKKRKLP